MSTTCTFQFTKAIDAKRVTAIFDGIVRFGNWKRIQRIAHQRLVKELGGDNVDVGLKQVFQSKVYLLVPQVYNKEAPIPPNALNVDQDDPEQNQWDELADGAAPYEFVPCARALYIVIFEPGMEQIMATLKQVMMETLKHVVMGTMKPAFPTTFVPAPERPQLSRRYILGPDQNARARPAMWYNYALGGYMVSALGPNESNVIQRCVNRIRRQLETVLNKKNTKNTKKKKKTNQMVTKMLDQGRQNYQANFDAVLASSSRK